MCTVIIQKENVRNPLRSLNTVGSELLNIFLSNGIVDGEQRMGIRNLNAKESLSEKQIKKACDILMLGNELASFLVSFQNDYAEEKIKCNCAYHNSKKNFTKLKGIIPLLRNEFTDGVDVLDDILDFFDAGSEEEIFEASDHYASLFRMQNNVNVDPINLKAWLRRGEIDFSRKRLPEYDEQKFKEWIDSKVWEQSLTSSKYFKSVPGMLSEYGIAVILVPFLPKTVYGCVRWINGNPLIQISDRSHDLATCWFTLFHEFGHVILHKNVEIFDGEINNVSKSLQKKREKEANKFANSYLFNGDDLRKEVFANKSKGIPMTAQNLAKKYAVDSIFTAYWLRRAQYLPEFQAHIHIDFLDGYQN